MCQFGYHILKSFEENVSIHIAHCQWASDAIFDIFNKRLENTSITSDLF